MLKKDTDIIHVAMGGGGQKKFSHMLRGGSKSFGGLRRGGSKKFDDKNFQLPSPPTKVFMNTPLLELSSSEIEKKNQTHVVTHKVHRFVI